MYPAPYLPILRRGILMFDPAETIYGRTTGPDLDAGCGNQAIFAFTIRKGAVDLRHWTTQRLKDKHGLELHLLPIELATLMRLRPVAPTGVF